MNIKQAEMLLIIMYSPIQTDSIKSSSHNKSKSVSSHLIDRSE